MSTAATIQVYGADWCRDCRRTSKQLTDLGVPFEYIDLIENVAAAETAKQISGRTNIPVVVYPDGTHQVEPSNDSVEQKLRELALI